MPIANRLALLWVIAPMSWALVAQPKPTIEQYADCLSERVMKELTDTPTPLIFAPEKNFGFKRELDLRLQAFLLSRGVQVRESPSESAPELRYDVQSATVSVEELNGQWLRTVSLAAFIKLSLNGEIQRAKLATAQRVDTLSRADLERLNDLRYAETTIEPRRALLDKAVAPILTTLSLGIIVYLFFSVRSN